MEFLYFAILILTLLLLAYNRTRLLMAVAIMVSLTVAWTELRHLFYVPSWFRFANGIAAVVLIGFSIKPLRRLLISDRLYGWFRNAMPRLSGTEREALDAGTVWWDAEIFSGRPRWRRLLKTPAATLSAREQALLEGPLEDLCRMLDDWTICARDQDLPQAAWELMRRQRMFGMIIPEAYGGLGFSAHGASAVVLKLASRSLTAAITVMVPNSLGPAELLLRYGTEQQKSHYLPRLASGEDLPCFALTSTEAGSDATAMTDSGVVCKGMYQGREVLGLRVNWDKRYITLAPVASLIGLAFTARDPERLISDQVELGITCALVPAATPGVEIGSRHLPLAGAFMNGPTHGKDVFVPMDWIIGGQAGIGRGWGMLTQCLAAGRGISLPALGVAGGKMAALTAGAYARIRRQFASHIGAFEGVEERLSRIGGKTYRMDAARMLTLAALDQGHRPAVLSAIVKQQLTEGSRECINDAMDIHGGKALATGPSNYLEQAYRMAPVSITVEGANILLRSLIIFGQGAIRSHPWLLKLLEAAGDPKPEARVAFDRSLFAWVGHVLSNLVRANLLGLTAGWATRAPVRGPVAVYYRQLTRMCAAFALTGDMVVLSLGQKFRLREKLSGRLADALTHLYLGSAVLKRWEDQGRPAEDLPLLQWAMDDSLWHIQQSLLGVLQNFPIAGVGSLLKAVVFPLALPYRPPSDRTGKQIASLLLSENPARNRLVSGVYLSDGEDAVGQLLNAFHLAVRSTTAETAVRNALKEAVTWRNHEVLVQRAVESGVITEEQATLVRLAQVAVREVLEVDEFPASRIEDRA